VTDTHDGVTMITTDDTGFAQFWAAYPRKTAKVKAERAWGKLAPGVEVQAMILASVAAHRAEWTDPRFIPYPATFLNQQRWTDEVAREARIGRPPTTADAYGWCDHMPRCGTFAGHEMRQARDARAVEGERGGA